MNRLQELQQKIADSTARSDIECYCRTAGGEPQTVEALRSCFYDTAQVVDLGDAEAVADAVEYLTLRGLLRIHPANARWVRPIDVSELAEAA